ncbi:MAG: LysR family transcriptional regulator [Blautia sp.]|nr:LysR family transcriptional regulator [Blautia sp.]
MNFKELQYILTIAEEGSISRAAERLFMAQASLSQSLRLMEEELGAPIFERSNRGVKPTVAGAGFLKQAEQLLNFYRGAEDAFRDQSEKVTGVVEFGTASFRGRHLLPDLIKEFYDLYPEARIHITEKDSNHLERLLRDGLVDMALTALPTQNLESFVVDSCFRDEVLLVVKEGHPVLEEMQEGKEGKPFIPFSEAAKHEFILSEPATRLGHIARREFSLRGLSLQSRNDNVTAAFAVDMAKAGLGLALTYESCVREREGVHYLSLGEEGVYLTLALLYPVGTYHSRATLALTKLLREKLEKKLVRWEKEKEGKSKER